MTFDREYRGEGLRIDGVVPRSPADLVAVGLQPGDVVLLKTRRGSQEREVEFFERDLYAAGPRLHDPERNNMNQEHGGCVPDYLVERAPAELLAGEGPQLAKAVQLMLGAADRALDEPQPSPRRPAAAR